MPTDRAIFRLQLRRESTDPRRKSERTETMKLQIEKPPRSCVSSVRDLRSASLQPNLGLFMGLESLPFCFR